MKKILVVDDNQDILEMITLLLELQGYKVIALNNGHVLNEVINEGHPDVIIMDVMLGDMDGRKLCADLKRNLSTSGIPVIMISAGHELQLTSMDSSSRPNDFLAKPFDIECLIEKVQFQLAG